uniref:Uncharacterized protein n=1 Tax=Aegilops tauschii subsp. strangulata TaxID=200361 RepID=A0A453QY34_AEGTS
MGRSLSRFFFVFNSILHGIFLFSFICICRIPDRLLLENAVSCVPY